MGNAGFYVIFLIVMVGLVIVNAMTQDSPQDCAIKCLREHACIQTGFLGFGDYECKAGVNDECFTQCTTKTTASGPKVCWNPEMTEGCSR